ncbi:MAG TPA: excinuclease ABC subunit UvrC [Paludibacteraceae bacterium]|nr:excinuclease ABC subunit UvrC [Paludibacteraceae bacterium]
MSSDDYIKKQLLLLPDSPGVYQFFNAEGVIIYVGKAKNLKRRVASYFNKVHDSVKTTILVKHIRDIKYIVVNSENEALLLENNFIKKYQPRYNILLKDGKTYPWLCITREAFPRVFKTRTIVKGADYFGPYSSVWTLDVLLELVRELYPIRTCRLPLTQESIAANKFKVCLQYHIHNCTGVCEGLQSQLDYRKMIDEIKEIAKGNSHAITDYLVTQMHELSENQQFEEAQKIKEKHDSIVKYQSKTVITTTNDDNLDVFAYDEDENSVYINILRIAKGSVIQGFTIEYQKKLEEEKEELLAFAILELRHRLKSSSKTLIVPFYPDLSLDNVEIIIPQRGDKKKLLDLSMQNVRQYKLDKLKQAERLNPDQRAIRLMKEIQTVLHLPNLPQTIDCFDNSNISGSDAVAACVVFKKARPSKKDYRKYIIKTVQGPDDYASMQEVVRRRYTRMINEGASLPDLIITDGGKGQMEVVRRVLEDELHVQIPIAGLAKNQRHHTSELLFGFPPAAIGLKPTDFLFKFLASVQDEVHRFAITFHRDKRSKNQTVSELDSIKGIGEKTKIQLLNVFKSLKRIQNAEKLELEKIIGTHKASIIYDYFHPEITS